MSLKKLLVETQELSESITDDVRDEIIEHAIELSNRRVWLCKNAPICPKCNTKQIQLIQWTSVDKSADWKCRKCRHPFSYEPLTDQDLK